MTTTNGAEGTYKVWANDNLVYGPVIEAALCAWILEQRVQLQTWILSQTDNTWRQAKDIPGLRDAFQAVIGQAAVLPPVRHSTQIEAGELRAFDVFSGLTDEELAQFIRFGELVQASPEELLIKNGDPGDALYFVLSGSVRARMLIGLKETILARIPAGEFFGEIAMFTQSPRSADVVAVEPTRLLRLSGEAFLLMIKETPKLAGPVLFGIARVMAARIIASNQTLRQEVGTSFAWR